MRDRLTRAVEALRTGDALAAADLAGKAVREQPRLGPAHLLLGRALLELNDPAGAATSLRTAVELTPDSGEAHVALALALQAQGLVEEPYSAFIRALELEPDAPHIQVRAADFLFQHGQLDEAERLYDLAARQGRAEAITGLVNIRERRGDLDDALALLEDNAPALERSLGLRFAAARLMRRKGRSDEALALLEAVSADELTPQAVVALQHALGDVREELGDFDGAFAAWSEANALRDLRFDAEAHAQLLRELAEAYPVDGFGALTRAANGSELPVLVVGAPRSGTSLTEQILSAHPDVHGAGELDDLNEIARTGPYGTAAELDAAAERYLARLRALAAAAGRPDARRVTDKMPHNLLHLGLAAQLLPGARVVYCTRDPLDVGLSIFSRDFHETHDYAADLESIGVFLRRSARLMEHWRAALPLPVFELRYEDLVAAPEDVTRALLDFCGLDWDPAVLEFHRSKRLVHTASYDQVRQPIHARSVRRSHRYAQHLEPLRRGLED